MAETIQGKPCKRGHTLKYKSTGSCVECVRLRDSKRHGRHVDHWSLTYIVVKVPDVNWWFWNALHSK